MPLKRQPRPERGAAARRGRARGALASLPVLASCSGMVTRMLIFTSVLLLQFYTALSAGSYGTCPAVALTVITSSVTVNATDYGGTASFLSEIVTVTGAYNSGLTCGNNDSPSTATSGGPSGTIVLYNSNSSFTIFCGNAGSCKCCFTITVANIVASPPPEVSGCSPGSWVNVSGFTSPTGLNGVYAPYMYNSAGFSDLSYTLPYTSWPPYTNWPSGMTCNLNSYFPGNVFPDGAFIPRPRVSYCCVLTASRRAYSLPRFL